ncbi:hypothetical protein GUJ93_ZPchr0002g26626 [Zizania palustris]|uniref:Uncharacterized protein n=1 Tax=Zizania palustris TaxID=103762 RepID=A0A8J5RCA6_ZIZPA|nr:hypothetical protein GUJ93_ZPchr0002g26626 [Zizania palustris]
MVGRWRRAGVAEVAWGDWAMGAEFSVEAVRGRVAEVTQCVRPGSRDHGIAGGSGWVAISSCLSKLSWEHKAGIFGLIVRRVLLHVFGGA